MNPKCLNKKPINIEPCQSKWRLRYTDLTTQTRHVDTRQVLENTHDTYV